MLNTKPISNHCGGDRGSSPALAYTRPFAERWPYNMAVRSIEHPCRSVENDLPVLISTLVLDATRNTSSLFTRGPTYQGAPVWFPDGSRLSFFSLREGLWTLYEKSLNNQSDEHLLLSAANSLVPDDWSPTANR